jgi:MerR family redox-sensitive transcriptional activator SoxR
MLPIGEVARRSGFAASALRYYERAGLIPHADHRGGNAFTARRSSIAWR